MPANSQYQDNKPLHGPNLILDVENFGPIAEAKNIEFRPMTVFVGPSNTGKSYLAMLLHAMLQWRPERRYWRFGARRPNKNSIGQHAIVTEIANWKRRWNSRVEASHESEYIEIPSRELSNQIQVELCKISAEIVNQHTALIRRSIREYFEVNRDDELVLNQVSATETPFVELRVTSGLARPDRCIEIYDDNAQFRLHSFSISEQAYESLDWLGTDEGSDVAADFFFEDFTRSNVDQLLPKTVSRYLPASRTGIMLSHAILTDRIVARASDISREGAEFVPFHRIHAEFLRAINAVGRTSPGRRRTPLGALSIADKIESGLLEGAINVETGPIGLPRFVYAREGVEFPLFRSSSMITEIAPLVLFLRYYMSDRDLMIVEEPESHLHPIAQQRLAALLTLMIRAGFRVLITTHSDYFVEQLGIFHNASFLDDVARAETLRCFGPELDSGLYLRGDEIAVYSFNEGVDGSGTTVDEVTFDEDQWEYGTTDHAAAVIEQFNRNARVTEARMSRS